MEKEDEKTKGVDTNTHTHTHTHTHNVTTGMGARNVDVLRANLVPLGHGEALVGGEDYAVAERGVQIPLVVSRLREVHHLDLDLLFLPFLAERDGCDVPAENDRTVCKTSTYGNSEKMSFFLRHALIRISTALHSTTED